MNLTPEELQEFESEMERLQEAQALCTEDPRPENFYYEDGPRAYSH